MNEAKLPNNDGMKYNKKGNDESLEPKPVRGTEWNKQININPEGQTSERDEGKGKGDQIG